MVPPPSKRASSIPPFAVMQTLRRAAELSSSPPPPFKTICHLEVGQPSHPPPDAILTPPNSSHTPYTPALGCKPLREALAKHYSDTYDHCMTSDDIVATTGASGAFVALFAACFDPADNVIVAVPGYPCYERIMKAFSINPERISVDAHTNFQPSVEQVLELVQKKRIRGLIIASPANPTGAVISEEQLEGIASICHQHDIRLIVDEIYHGVCARPPTALLLSQAYPGAGIVVVNSFSKYWCMTGYRIGWLATHDATIIPCLETILQNLSICPPTPSQYTAISALQPVHKSVYERYTESYKRNIDVVCQVLRRAGLQVFSPEGAFYVWANCEGVCNKLQLSGSTELCERLLEECGVACVAGSDFDEVGGEKFVRFSCAGGEDEVREGVHRVEVFVRKM